jgi:D-alanine-D-alanine ligase-like ATP-grasp enzyme
VIVEEFLRGRDYRVLVTGKKIAAASWRRPPHVTGDGVSTCARWSSWKTAIRRAAMATPTS